jgi:PAS domain S-box-containing protein
MEEKSALFHLLLDQSSEVVYSMNLRSLKFEFINEAVASLLGFSVQEIQNFSVHQFYLSIHPEERESIRQDMDNILQQQSIGGRQNLQYRFRNKAGDYLLLRDSFRIVRDSNGEPLRKIGTLQAVKNTFEQAHSDGTAGLPPSDEKYKLLLDTLYEGVWQIDEQQNTVYVNPRMAEILGYLPDEMMGKSLFSFMDEQGVRLAHQHLSRRKNGAKERHQFEFLAKDKRRVYVSMASSPFLDREGRYMGAIATVSDISEQLKAQKLLREREEMMTDITDNLPGLVMTYLLKPDGTDSILFITKGVRDLYEVSPEEAIQDASNIWSKIQPEDLPIVASSVQESAQQLTPWRCEFRAVMQDGSTKWLYGRASPKKLEDGSVLWHTLTLDITSEKIAQQRLKESEERIQLVLKGANDAYWDYDILNNKLYYSDRWREIFGYRQQEFQPEMEKWGERVHPDDKLRVEKVINEAVSQQKDSYEVEYRHLHKNGHYVPVLARGFIKRNEKGEAIRMSGTLFDMSKIKKTEKLLRESEIKFRSIVESANAIIYTFDQDYKFTYISPEAQTNTGYQVDELMQTSPFDLIHPEDVEEFRAFISSISDTRQLYGKIEYRIFKKDGTVSWRSGTVRPLLDEQGSIYGYLGIAHDIHELKEKERILAEAVAMKDKLFSVIGHDLKSPLNSILGLTEVMAENVRKGEYEEVRDLFEWVRKSSQKSVDLLSNLLDWARSQTESLQFSPEPLAVLSVLQDTVTLMDEAAAEKKILIVLNAAADTKVMADENMTKTVLRNLLSNAIKYTYEGGEIRLSAEKNGAVVQICVQDNGTGISYKKIEKLFSPEKVSSTPGTKREKGTGLGLLLCKDFVEKQGGEIWALSDEKKGSAFYFTLPSA